MLALNKKAAKLLRKKLYCICFQKNLSDKVIRRKTCLHEFHLERKGKMVEFAGFEMPVTYADQSVSSSHNHTRNHLSIFDVSHMLQSTLKGKHCVQFLESLTVSDIEGLKVNNGTLSLFTNEHGGIKDDLIITKTETGDLYLVSNAGCMEKDIAHIQNHLKSFKRGSTYVEFEIITNKALIAIQGPQMEAILQPFVECSLKELSFMMSTTTTICGIKDCRLTRCGYTGEDGVEISIPIDKAKYIVENILFSERDEEIVKLAGLAARDSLRLEAGLCLYGNDISEETTPVEAGLTWTIGKRRREEGNFPGAKVILQQLKQKPAKKRVGLISVGPSPRAHTRMFDGNGECIGEVTSGSPSPFLNKNIAMGYLPLKYAKPGTIIQYDIRKQLVDAEVVKFPFVPTKYYTKKE